MPEVARQRLCAVLVYALLCIDSFAVCIPHAGRYGVNGFNVSHVSALDPWLPIATPVVYIALMVAVALMAGLLALGALPPAWGFVLAGLYSLAWLMSRLDMYQHHYLLSLVLVLLALSSRWTSAFRLLVGTIGIVFTFTAIAKCEPEWLSGHVLSVVGQGSLLSRIVLAIAPSFGFEILAKLMVPVQAFVALAFFCACSDRFVPVQRLGFAVATVFHASVETMNADIGIFSAYMIAMAFAILGPLTWVERLERLMVRKWRLVFAFGCVLLFMALTLFFGPGVQRYYTWIGTDCERRRDWHCAADAYQTASRFAKDDALKAAMSQRAMKLRSH